MIEEVSETKQCIADEAEKKWGEKQILDNHESIRDPLDKEVTDKKILLESVTKDEEINLQKLDNNETSGKLN